MNDPKTARHDHESAADYLRRIVSNINSEQEYILDYLKTPQAIVDFFELWHVYDTEYLDGILEGISEGDDPKPFYEFREKYGLDWETNAEADHR